MRIDRRFGCHLSPLFHNRRLAFLPGDKDGKVKEFLRVSQPTPPKDHAFLVGYIIAPDQNARVGQQ